MNFELPSLTSEHMPESNLQKHDTLISEVIPKSAKASNIVIYMDVSFEPDDTIAFSTSYMKGLNANFERALALRFEMRKLHAFHNMPLKSLTRFEQYFLKDLLNFMIPNKFDVDELIRLNILRKFVIRSYAGLCHAQGKPAHGQRTGSNANTAYKRNKITREFLSERRKIKQAFEDSLLNREQSKVKRKKKRRKRATRSKEDRRYVDKPKKLEKRFKSGRRALRKKKKMFDAGC